MPELSWVGKSRVLTHHLDVPYRVLKHEYSFDGSSPTSRGFESDNLIIQGDNLEALKALLPKYEGRVNCIYIDPPYNTGNEGWIYNDNVNDPRLLKWLGSVVGKEGEDLSRHDKWLTMMYPRLRLLHKLLAPNGVIFMSIDDNESAHLRVICDEIFGRNNFVSDISWQRNYSTRNDSKGIPAEVEHLLVFSKSPNWNPGRLERTDEMDAKYRNPDNDVSAWRTSDAFAPGASTHQGMVYAIQHPFTGELIYPATGNCWRYQQDEMLRIFSGWGSYELRDLYDDEARAEVCGIPANEVRQGVKALMLTKPLNEARDDADLVLARGQWPRFFFTKNGLGGVARKTYLDQVGGALPSNFWSHKVAGHTDEAKKEIRAIFDGRVAFDTPKPTRLIERVLAIATQPSDIVLDSFAGSGTTAHAVLNANKADGGNRTFILVELGDYADTVTAERVKRAITGYKGVNEQTTVLYEKKLTASSLKNGAEIFAEAQAIADDAKDSYTKVSKPFIAGTDNGKNGSASVKITATQVHEHDVSGTGGSFSFYSLGEPIIVDGLLNGSVGRDHIRDYLWFSETSSSPLEDQSQMHPSFMGTHINTSYFFAYDEATPTVLDHAFLANIPFECAAESYVIYADMCMLSEEELRARNITFKKIPRDIAGA